VEPPRSAERRRAPPRPIRADRSRRRPATRRTTRGPPASGRRASPVVPRAAPEHDTPQFTPVVAGGRHGGLRCRARSSTAERARTGVRPHLGGHPRRGGTSRPCRSAIDDAGRAGSSRRGRPAARGKFAATIASNSARSSWVSVETSSTNRAPTWLSPTPPACRPPGMSDRTRPVIAHLPVGRTPPSRVDLPLPCVDLPLAAVGVADRDLAGLGPLGDRDPQGEHTRLVGGVDVLGVEGVAEEQLA